MRYALVTLMIAGAASCTGAGGASGVAGPGPSSGPSSGATAADLAFCAQETNRYRALAGVAPVAQSPDVEAYARAAAQSDHASGVAHGYTNGPNRPPGAFAENEAVRWPHTVPIRDIIASAMAAFWREGPGGGHYDNLRGAWRLVGCGVHAEGGAVTFVQHFR